MIETLQISGFLLVFVSMALLMFFRKLPALIALPVMAVLVAKLGGVTTSDLLSHVIGGGAVKLHTAYTVAIFGGMLSFLLQKSGVAENLIKNGAELAGDRPWSVGLIMLLLIAMLFTTLGGLGAIIMVATIVLPIMSSVGFSSLTIAGLFLIGINLGGILNAGNWALYIDVLKLEIGTIRSFALVLFGLSLLMALAFLTLELKREGHKLPLKKLSLYGAAVTLLLLSLGWGYLQLRTFEPFVTGMRTAARVFSYLLLAAAGLTAAQIFYDLGKKVTGRERYMSRVKWYSYLTPIVPLLLILILKMTFITAFAIGLFYGFLTTYRKGSINMLSQAIIEGGGSVMPAVVLMMGIGMLLNAIMGPGGEWSAAHQGAEWPVLEVLKPVMVKIIPSSPWLYVLVFTLLAPLSLYRGPLNVWGMGYGMAAIMLASGALPAAAIMGMLISVGQIQGICDPTNTQNVWIANELHLDVQEILWRTLPYVWIVAALGLAAQRAHVLLRNDHCSMNRKIKIGIDVGGTFTHAAAVNAMTYEIVAKSYVPTTHTAAEGVAAGVVEAMHKLLREGRIAAEEVVLIAHSTTQATNALLEGDVAKVGVIGMGSGLETARARRETNVGDIELAPGKFIHTVHRFLDSGSMDAESIRAAIAGLQQEGAQVIVASESFGVDNPGERRARRRRRRGDGSGGQCRLDDFTALWPAHPHPHRRDQCEHAPQDARDCQHDRNERARLRHRSPANGNAQ